MLRGFKVFTGAHYIGGCTGYDESRRDCMKRRTKTWERGNCTIRKTAWKYPQEIYATVVRAIQSEWIFLKRVTNNTGDAFSGEGKMIQETILPFLFFVKSKSLSPIVGTLSKMRVKKSGMGLLNPVVWLNEQCLSLQHAITELIWAVMV